MEANTNTHTDNVNNQVVPTITEEYKEFMKDFQQIDFLNVEWERRGDSYVQFSLYDDDMIGSSCTHLYDFSQNV